MQHSDAPGVLHASGKLILPMWAAAMTDRAATRQQLAEMRKRLVGNLGQQIEGGDLALLADINGALAAMAADGSTSVEVAPGGRAILAGKGPEAPSGHPAGRASQQGRL